MKRGHFEGQNTSMDRGSMAAHSVSLGKFEDHLANIKDNGPRGGRPYYKDVDRRSIAGCGAGY